MKNKVLLDFNYGFKWKILDNLCFKGNVIYKDELLDIKTLLSLLSSLNGMNDFVELSKSFKGLFSIIYEKEDTTYITVDPTRTFPIFYCKTNDSYIITDNTFNICFNSLTRDTNADNMVLGMRYVLGKNTRLKDLFQVRAGECLIIGNSIDRKFYHSFVIGKTEIFNNLNDLSEQFERVLLQATQRLVQSTSYRTLIVPLSGGYDSRLVLSLLHKLNYKNIICYTYGSIEDNEVQISKEIAERLGYKWLFFDIADNYVPENYINSTEFSDYVKFSFNNSSLIHLQDYFFVKTLKERNLIPVNAIFLPGHTGDVLAGNHLYNFDNKSFSRKKYVSQIIKRHHVLKGYTKQRSIENVLFSYYDKTKLSHSLIDNYNIKERQSKFIVNSVRNYEFFGYEHRLLLWDQDISNFFKKLPFDLKHHSNFYVDNIFRLFFSKYNIDFIPLSKIEKKSKYKKWLKPYIPQFLLNKIRGATKSDSVNFRNVAYKDLLDDMNKNLGLNISNLSELLAEWLIRRY